MVQNRAADDLTDRSIEWVHDMVVQWIEANEAAQAIQAALPGDIQEQLHRLPHGYRGLAGAMAMAVNPQTVREAHEWLISAEAQIRALGSLSHTERMIVAKTDTGIGATVDEDQDLLELARANERAIAELRLRVADLEAATDHAQDRRSSA